MGSAVGRRFTLLAALTLALAALAAAVLDGVLDAPPAALASRRGDQRLADGEWAEALAAFDEALAAVPEHRGAMMGKAIALAQLGAGAEAEALLSQLIARLAAEEEAGAGRGMLAAAYANRGIVRDRAGRIEEALADYRAALAVDGGAVAGPGVIERILSGNAHPSSVAKRAAYLERQLQLPVAERRLHQPEIDARQRMHRP